GARAPRRRAADRRAVRAGAVDRRARSRRTRPGRPARRVPPRRRAQGPPDGDLRLHDQGLAPADRGASGQPLRAAHRGAVARSGEQARRRPGASLGAFCRGLARAARVRRGGRATATRAGPRELPPPVPPDLGRSHAGEESTQQSFGRFFMDLARAAPEAAAHVVTVSPDVASSTNLGGWINRVGVWNMGERIDWFADDSDTLVRWSESEHGRHIELGIAEGNLVGLLGELGATWSRDGTPLLPIGTLYDPFVNRALEPWSFGMYAGGQSILVGTPAGVTLAPEGGAHQSIITPSVGIEQPRCTAWEPAFGQDLEWTLLHALAQLGRDGGSSSYLRLSTRPIDQALASVPEDAAA